MDNGSISLNTDMYGVPITGTAISILTSRTDIGPGRNNMVGSGSPIMNGDGRHSTMAAGSMILMRDGYGFPITNGGRPG